MENKIKESYQQSVENYALEVASLKRKNNGFITGELLSFGAMATFLVCYFALEGDTRIWLCAAFLSLVSYFMVRHFDEKNKEKIEHKTALMQVCQDEFKAMEGDFSSFETGEQYQDAKHPYAFDLDVFGTDSLFNRICHTITTGGSDKLATLLARITPFSREEIERRRNLQMELADGNLAGDANWRWEFFALGEKNKNEILSGPIPIYSQVHSLHVDIAAEPTQKVIGFRKIDSAAVLDAIANVAAIRVPSWLGSRWSLLWGWLFIIGVCASVLLAMLDFISVNVPIFWVIAQYIVVFGVCKQTLDQIDSHGGKLRHQLMAYSQILLLIARRDFRSEMGREMQAKLAEALPSFTQLESILKGYDRRGNFLGLFFTDSFLLSDFFLVRQFLKWKNSYMAKMEEWVDIVSEMDAMVSMADYRYNHPEAKDAQMVDGPSVVFEAKNLYHPFLGAKAVKNDFDIKDGNYYIVTGANMAGKSTFLRSLGVNYILAMAGMPVFAGSLRISRFRLFSSMRTSDDLTHGISYFNAELLRLEQLMQFCKGKTSDEKELHGDSMRTLIILDEILKGTNSVDKLNGSRLFLESISQLPVSGVIATHDLELSKMENNSELGIRFHNYCFEIDLGLDVTYTYKIQKGVAKNQNATFLLHKLIDKNL